MKILFKYKHDGKVRTFENESDVNLFTGASILYHGEFEHSAVTVMTFYNMKFGRPDMSHIFRYDDWTPMTAEEWVDCATKLLSSDLKYYEDIDETLNDKCI